MNWAIIGRFLRLGFYLRVPLGFLILLAAIGPISQFTAAHALLGNLFDLQSDDGAVGWNVFIVSLGGFLLAFSAVTSLNVTLFYGTQRFSDSSGVAKSSNFQLRQSHPLTTFLCGLGAGLSLIVTVIWRTEGGRLCTKLASAASAFIVALTATLIAKVIQLLLTNPKVTPHPPPFLVFPVYRFKWLWSWLERLYHWPADNDDSYWAKFFRSAKQGGGRFFQWPLRFVEGAGQGYLVPVKGSNRVVVASGHVFALSLFTIAFFLYLLIGLNKSRIFASPALVPGLAYVLLFLAVACWSYSALAFFLDRYHFPLFLGVILLASITASAPKSDHYFSVETDASVKRLGVEPTYRTPASYLSERTRDGRHKRIVIVATPGGGIQAAAWTAQVLTGLDTMFPTSGNGPLGFRDSVAMISSVSGGSLGAMIYVASFLDKVHSECVPRNAMRSAIDEAAWGWTSPDFWHTIFPWVRPNLVVDRGWAVERKWAVINNLSPEPDRQTITESIDGCGVNDTLGSFKSAEADTFLSDWIREGTKLPALVFNSTLVESGQHVVFSTTKFPLVKDPRGIVNFYDLYGAGRSHFDVRVTTAARLSASFPYVAPAARPSGPNGLSAPGFHFVDGGYYDNLGIDSVIGWLTAAFPAAPDPKVENTSDVKDILILQIQHFNASEDAAGAKGDGWAFQLLAPLKGLLSMWDIAPVYRDRNELGLFIQEFNSRSRLSPHIRTVTIPYCGASRRSSAAPTADDPCAGIPGGLATSQPTETSKKKAANCADQPLSWKLSQSQKDCIQSTWEGFIKAQNNKAIQQIKAFLEEPFLKDDL